jgi:hypothetical protein
VVVASLVASLLAALLAGCAAAPLPVDETTPRRRPDGVAIDPISAPPAARDRAASTDALVTLRTPLGIDRALATVQDFFRKVVVEDAEGLDALFTRDALAITTLVPGAGGGQTPSALLFWQGRFRKLDYTRLAGEVIYRDAEVSLYRAEDVLESPPHPALRVELIAGNDVVARVTILTPRVGADRLFGDEMILWLRRDGDRYRIYRILEEFQLG